MNGGDREVCKKKAHRLRHDRNPRVEMNRTLPPPGDHAFRNCLSRTASVLTAFRAQAIRAGTRQTRCQTVRSCSLIIVER